MRQHGFRVWGLLFVIGLVGAGCATEAPTTAPITSDAEFSVVSGDGSAELVVAAGSLPAGVDPEEISVERVELADLTAGSPALAAVAESGLPPGPAYRLLPAGLAFSEPARLRLEAGETGALVTGFLVDDENGIAPLEAAEPATDPGDDAPPVIEFLIPHFSVVTIHVGLYDVALAWPSTVMVDVPFTTTVALSREDGHDFPYLFRGSMIGSINLTPGIEDLGTGALLDADTSTDVTYTCTDEGPATIKVYAFATVDRPILEPILDRLRMFLNEDYKKTHWSGSLQVGLECMAGNAFPQAAAGAYEGSLEVVAIPHAPGSSYRENYALTLDECGGAKLVQRGSQETAGTVTVTEVAADGSAQLRATLAGEGDDYREGYVLLLEFDRELGVLRLEGVLAGGGHGFGAPPSTERLHEALGIALESATGVDPGQLDDLGWVGTIQGEMERGGDAPDCGSVPTEIATGPSDS